MLVCRWTGTHVTWSCWVAVPMERGPVSVRVPATSNPSAREMLRLPRPCLSTTKETLAREGRDEARMSLSWLSDRMLVEKHGIPCRPVPNDVGARCVDLSSVICLDRPTERSEEP